MAALVEIKNLHKVYRGKRGHRVTALAGLDLEVMPGEIFGFLGPNGAGKSTTIKTLVGLIQPTSGTATINGLPVNDPETRRRIGFLPENPSFYEGLSAREYLELVGKIFGMAPADLAREVARVLELLDLQHAAQRPIRGYSKGMVQRLGLAQALLHDPDLYILDEPMSGLDPLGRALVKRIMLSLKEQGKTVFFSTHVTSDVEAVCDRLAVIVQGKVRAVTMIRDLLWQGVDSYLARVVGTCPAAFDVFEVRDCPGGLLEVVVPGDGLNDFMAIVTREKGVIQTLEPQRHDVEQFFLAIVNQVKE